MPHEDIADISRHPNGNIVAIEQNRGYSAFLGAFTVHTEWPLSKREYDRRHLDMRWPSGTEATIELSRYWPEINDETMVPTLRLRRQQGSFPNVNPDNELGKHASSLGVSWECGGGNECPYSSPSDTEYSPSIQYIAEAWPRLQPHVREAIFTLIDATLRQQQLEGGQS